VSSRGKKKQKKKEQSLDPENQIWQKHRIGRRKFQITYHHTAKQQSAENQELRRHECKDKKRNWKSERERERESEGFLTRSIGLNGTHEIGVP